MNWHSLPRYLFINGIFATCIYFGFFGGIEGAKNIALFIAFISGLYGLILGAVLLHDREDFLKSLGKNYKPTVPLFIDLIFDIPVLFIFIWYGHYAIATLYSTCIMTMIELRKAYINQIFDILKKDKI